MSININKSELDNVIKNENINDKIRVRLYILLFEQAFQPTDEEARSREQIAFEGAAPAD